MVLIQRRNLLETVRPELVLTGWARNRRGEGEASHEAIAFQTIRNVGRGPGLNVVLNCFHEANNRPTATMPTIRLPILAFNESESVNAEIILWWKNIQPDAEHFRHVMMKITIFCWDSRNIRHETNYTLFATELGDGVGVGDAIAHGVMLVSRTTTSRSVWFLKLLQKWHRATSWINNNVAIRWKQVRNWRR